MSLTQRLEQLSIVLPAQATPGAQYASAVVHGGCIWVSGQLPREGDRVLVSGKLGHDVSLEEGQRAARLALIRTLAAIRDTVGDLDVLDRVLKLTVYVNSTDTFTQHSAVADGASSLLYELLGPEKGGHARTSVGVEQLPRNGAVELDVVAALR
jgi:enamine deaminase RidA (YjgF/YER057c/UK114 family)